MIQIPQIRFAIRLAFHVPINLSKITDLPSLCIEYIKISIFSNYSCMSLLKNYLLRSTYNLLGLRLDLCTILIKAGRTVLPFASLKGLTHAYLMKTFMTHKKYLTFLFLEDNDLISAKSAAQILSFNLA